MSVRSNLVMCALLTFRLSLLHVDIDVGSFQFASFAQNISLGYSAYQGDDYLPSLYKLSS